MSPDYMTAPLGSIVRFRNGKSIKPGGAGPYPAYGSNGLIGRAETYLYENAIILGRVGAYCGSVEYCSGKFWASDNTIVVEPIPDTFDVRFARYALQHANLNHYAGGSAQPLLTQTALKGISFSLPPLATQVRIASILSAYDDLIAINERRIQILEEIAGRIFEEWFVAFRFPGCSIDLSRKDLPAGWCLGRLSDCLNLEYGKALTTGQRRAGQVAVYGSSGIVGQHDTPMVRGPGIIVGRKGNVGSIHWSNGDFYPIDTVFYVVSALPKRWLYQLLLRQRFLNSDSAVPGLNRNQALAIEVVLPPPELMVQYEKAVSPIGNQVEVLASSNERLRAARDLLLPKLISGEIEVGVAECELEDAA